MLMRSERDNHLDAAIDAAARSLTAGEPSAALRTRVRDRISERSPVASAFPFFVASAFRRKAGWWLVPACAMTALIAVMIGGRPLSGPALSGGPDKARPTDVRLTIDRASTQPAAVGRTLSVTGGPDKARPTGASAKARPPVTSAQPPAAATLELPFEELEPLIPPITIEPLETRLIVVDTSSGVMPIEIEPLQIEPLRGD
jgi:hypothetical protein